MNSTRIDNCWGSLHLLLENTGEVPVLRCFGRIVVGIEADALSAVVQSEPRCNLIIDLADVTAMDAGGLGALVALYGWAENRGRRLVLANPSRRVRRLMDITGLTCLLETCYLSRAQFLPIGLQSCTA